ncbi:MAG: histidine kinase [Muricauda sp.]|nr:MULTISPECIES: Hpt domain-containing protein [unclassified Allomuricauda]MAU16983.1 histidine kinase [Allomuricauda sp.]|tara:strand:+ start:11413 stop:11733 length:321 start_codon:yes stop_codon:yes gene_type:complete
MKETPNLEYVDKLAEGDEAFRQKFIAILKEELPKEKIEYHDTIKSSLLQEASEHVHKIKHKLNVLGMHNAYTMAVQHENELRNGEQSFKEEFLSILNDVEHYLKTI